MDQGAAEEGVVKVEVDVGAASVDGQHLVDDSGAAGEGVGDIRVKMEGVEEGKKGLMEGDREEGDERRREVDADGETGRGRQGEREPSFIRF